MLHNYSSSVEKMATSFKQYPWENKLAYAEYLAQTYYYIFHSTRLLAASAARFNLEDQALHRRFLKHTAEENAHELLALRDLQKLGYNIEDFPELPQTRTFYEIQYYKIEHKDPAALMGYILALEAMAAQEIKPVTEKLTRIYGSECVKLLKVHSDEDPDHVEKAMKAIESLRSDRLEAIEHNLEQTAILYVELLNAASAVTHLQNLKKAA